MVATMAIAILVLYQNKFFSGLPMPNYHNRNKSYGAIGGKPLHAKESQLVHLTFPDGQW